MTLNKAWRIQKFGGTSLQDSLCFKKVAKIIAESNDAVVVSAMGGMTQALEALLHMAESGQAFEQSLQSIVIYYYYHFNPYVTMTRWCVKYT